MLRTQIYQESCLSKLLETRLIWGLLTVFPVYLEFEALGAEK